MMETSAQTMHMLTACLTIFSSVVWTLTTGFCIADSNTRREKQVKWIALWLYVVYAAMWTFMIAYQYYPTLAVYLNSTGYLGLMLLPVQLYRLICKLSQTKRLKPFSLWHYLLPVLLAGSLAVWSLFVPYDVQLGLIEGRGTPAPAYPAYSLLFTSKPFGRFVITLVYLPLCLIRLYRYYREENAGTQRLRKPARWVWVVMVCVGLVLAGTLLVYLYPRGEMVARWPMLPAAFIVLTMQTVIGYHIISRNFLLYSGAEEEVPTEKERSAVLGLPQADAALPLTRKAFDHYMKTHKPWLDPGFLLTDLMGPFATPRNKLSAFVNRTYGVNFNRYINRLRLREMERLAALPSNASKTMAELAPHAGFTNDRGYRRAVEAERKSGGDAGAETNREDTADE